MVEGFLRRHGWGTDGDTSVIGHSEWQPGKVDPRGPIGKKGGTPLTMTAIRKRVAERLDHAASWSPSGGSSYVVKAGDTLSSIARARGTTWQKLAQLNGLRAPYTIHPGDKLKTK